MIEANSLNKWYGNFHALKNLSFSVEKGSVLGFLGPNGAGKSTTMKILTCFFKPDSGHAIIDGLDIEKDSLDIRKRVGFLHENAPYYPDMEVEDFLCFMASMRGLTYREFRKQLKYVTDLFQLEYVRKKRMSTLSKGYRQRVGFANAIIHNPEILILDEPTNGLDPNQIFEIRKVIKNLGQSKTIIVCSHILTEISLTCDKLLIIIDGRKAAYGTQEEISSTFLGGEELRLSVIGNNDISNKLKNIQGIISVEKKSANEKEVTDYKLLYKGSNPSLHIFDLAVENGLKIQELTHVPFDLDGVFRKLTNF